MGIRILLVDDETKYAMMLAKRMALRGFDVDYVHNGPDALSQVAKQRYDVAVLDVKMPGMGGIELRRALLKTAPQMKFIFLTGHGSKNDFETGVTEGAEYLSKPLQLEILLEKIQRLMKP